MTPRCAYCRHWNESSVGKGECRRYPPSVTINAVFTPHTSFPRTTQGDWCGEYREKERP